jgi:hypothetical protein
MIRERETVFTRAGTVIDRSETFVQDEAIANIKRACALGDCAAGVRGERCCAGDR